MKSVTLLFPHQLYPDHPACEPGTTVLLVEEALYFRQYPFHKSKLVFHRASMQAYADALRNSGLTVQYIDTDDPRADIRELIPALSATGTRRIVCFDPTDDWLLRRLTKQAKQHDIELELLPSPNFNCAPDEVIAGRKQPMYFQTDFYVRQRKKNKWLLDGSGKPLGGQWSFDADNRKPLPKGLTIPTVSSSKKNNYLLEAIEYVETRFPANYGAADGFQFPVTRTESLQWLDEFIRVRFAQFGLYEDAMHPSESFLFHSGLTPMLNVGLITPQEIIQRAIECADANAVPLASLEGFIRQVSGWREFIRLVYVQAGRKQRTTNYWKFNRKIPESFWIGQTGIIPVDHVIQKLVKTGYSHHIERLMILGNFMLLCEFDPDEVHRWFMTLYIDAYDWVMVPNVYGMTQFADGGLMTTKPYISGSNYVMKMGRWGKGDWQSIWDGLFWRFLSKHRSFFTQNPRLGMLVGTWDKMDALKQAAHLQAAEQFLATLDT